MPPFFAVSFPPIISNVLFPSSESPDMLWYRITFQVVSFWLRSAIFPVSVESKRRSEFSPSIQTASEPFAFRSALCTPISAVE